MKALELINKLNSFSKISARSLISIKGSDATKFLQGLTTNHMPLIESGHGNGLYTGFLSAQGRVLYDGFIYPKLNLSKIPEYLIEVDDRALEPLILHLKKFILRNKIELNNISNEKDVYQIWGPNFTSLYSGTLIDKNLDLLNKNEKFPVGCLIWDKFSNIGMRDPRHLDMGLRVILPKGDIPNLPSDFKQVNRDEYKLRRILYGIPEGVDDLFVNNSLPLESNFDYMHGERGAIWELTIRTYHTGVTRKRIVPVEIFKSTTRDDEILKKTEIEVKKDFKLDFPKSQSDIKLKEEHLMTTKEVTNDQNLKKKKKREVVAGKFCSGIYNVGLALMRLEYIQQTISSNTSELRNNEQILVLEDNNKVKPFSPCWWPKCV
ncbi:ccr4 associated factor [Clydaea vesicula]|uniref:Ccr4 associated factor n=1 Tax=Clydaea vesicula TaxID=447962 RepID=A0AAD5Y194_9FUNG|nr:ccr4 associated factor [Clydaea vesicula]